eukprot:TRINITY_DN70129_c0_g1_i1.p1 TRINITY_DN70129_c0_g1~~TRINITY_DN70129_c0_g1_i1.p1  ORF type:complete len:332 (+),score=33.31 TRINITY_DN70129_c0_g1_i1:3-998(+)
MGVLWMAVTLVALSGSGLFALSCGLIGLQGGKQVEEMLKATLADSTVLGDRYLWMQALFGSMSIGFAIGPQLGRFANQTIGWNFTFLALSWVMLTSCVFLFWQFPVNQLSKGDKDGNASTKISVVGLRTALAALTGNRDLCLLIAVRFFHASSAHLMFATLGLFITDALAEPKERLADLLTCNSIVFTAVQLLQPLLSSSIKNLQPDFVLMSGMSAIVIGRLLFFIFCTSFTRCLYLYAVTLVGIGFYLPSMSAALTASADKQSLGLVLGVSTTVESVTETIMPVVSGMLFEALGPYGPCGLSLIFSCVSAALGFAFYFQQRCIVGKVKAL